MLATLYVVVWSAWGAFVASVIARDSIDAGRPDFSRWLSPRFFLFAAVIPVILILILRWLLLLSSRPQEQRKI
jgi:hypothetical protein